MIETFVGIAKDFALEGLKDRSLYISNGVVRWASGEHKGQIHSHLQTTKASELAQQTILKLGDLQQSQEAMNIMLRTISGGMKALEIMSGLNVVLSVADIGISVAGFALMNAKLNAVQAAISDATSGIRDIQQDAIDRDFIRLRSWAEQYENTWHISDYSRAVPLLTNIAQGAIETQLLLEHHAQQLLNGGLDMLPAADRMLDGMAVTLGFRVSAAMAANEGDLARKIADDGARRIEALTGRIGEIDLVRARLPKGIDPASSDWGAVLATAREGVAPMLAKLRLREGNAATRSAPLTALDAHGMPPRLWLQMARSEEDDLLMFLPA